MPSKAAQKLLERMRRSKTGWKRDDVAQLYTGFGFTIQSGGSHDKVTHPDYPQLITSLPRHPKVHEYIVVQAVKNIDRLLELEKAKEATNEE